VRIPLHQWDVKVLGSMAGFIQLNLKNLVKVCRSNAHLTYKALNTL